MATVMSSQYEPDSRRELDMVHLNWRAIEYESSRGIISPIKSHNGFGGFLHAMGFIGASFRASKRRTERGGEEKG